MLAFYGIPELPERGERDAELTAEDLLGLFVRLWEALQDEALISARL